MNEKIRLNKLIAHNTKYSRREADKLIENGDVTIAGRVVTDLATKASLEDKISIKGKRLGKRKNYTIIVYHKHKGELVTKRDDRGRKTIYDNLPKRFAHFMSVGRLDFASEGLLLLSDAPDIVSALMHGDLERVYYVKIKGYVTSQMEKAMKEGLYAEDASKGGHEKSDIKSMEFAPFLEYKIIKNRPTFSTLKVTINEGKNRELRRFFGYFDAEVTDLKRVSYGKIDLGMLKPGKYRFLSEKEYEMVRDYLSFVKKQQKDNEKPGS